MNSIVSVQGLLNEVCEKLKGVKESSIEREKIPKTPTTTSTWRQREEIIIFPQTMLHAAG